MKRRRVVAAAAVGLLALALQLPDDLIPSLPRAAVLPVGAGLLVLAFWAAVRPTLGGGEPRTTYEPESPPPRDVPGDGFDEELAAAARQLGRDGSHARQRVRERLRSVAVDVLRAYGRQTQTAAREQLESGDWTDDHVAAGFLRGDTPPSSSSVWRRLSPRRASEDVPAAVRRTVAALTQYSGRSPPTRSGANWIRRFGRIVIGSRNSIEADDGAETAPPEAGTGIRRLHTWDGTLALVLGCLGVGLLASEPGVLLGSTVGVGYLAYARAAEPPDLDVSLDRSIEVEEPGPGEDVRVTLTVRNESDSTLPDLRLVDGVPSGLAVSEGSPRLGTPLRAGEEASLTYAVTASRGVHAFEDVRVAVRTAVETAERRTMVDPGETTLTCRPPFDPGGGPLRRDVTQFVGQLPTDRGGDGVEFHSVREYRRGDAVSRIDWARLARTRDLATVAFREERATSVAIVLDARSASYVAPDPTEPHALDRGIEAVGRLVPAFLGAGNRVGLAGYAPHPCWIEPSAARDVRTRMRETVTSHPAFPTAAPGERCYTLDWLAEFRRRHDACQVVLVSPLVDEGPAVLARRLEVYGYPTTVISVDPTSTDSVGRQLAHLERQARVHALREAGVRVVDWAWDEPLDLALAAADRRWSP